jgi:hypothetical protein
MNDASKFVTVPVPQNKRILDLAGQRFTRWFVVGFNSVSRHKTWWLCRCDCGLEKLVDACSLRTGKSQSCGCYRSEATTRRMMKHGKAYHPLYSCWKDMLTRCYKPNHKHFKSYGGRGIKVCERWHKCANFIEDMGPKPSARHTLERIDNSKGYEPGNCKWATRIEQANNTRTCRMINLHGETRTLSSWCHQLGFGVSTIRWRMDHGMNAEEAFSQPINKAFSRKRHGA